MRFFRFTIPLIAISVLFPAQLSAQAPSAPPIYSYADLADLAIPAPLTIDAQIRSATALKGAQAAGTPAGHARFYVEADVLALIRGNTATPARIHYVADIPLDSRGRAPKLKKQRVLLFARPVSGQAGMLQLVAPDAQLVWSADYDQRVRTILTEAIAPESPPHITGVGNAFHVPGAIPGEGETQIFLQTADNRPVSLSIIRRPNEHPHWSVALGEIVDEAAETPKPDTLLWYRLACGLPQQLPPRALAGVDPAAARASVADYQIVLAGLGRCVRTRTQKP